MLLLWVSGKGNVIPKDKIKLSVFSYENKNREIAP